LKNEVSDLKNETATLCKCPGCKQLSSIQQWNNATSDSFGSNIYALEKEVSNGDCLYACPKCNKEVSDSEIKRVDGTAFPVAITISYTMYVPAVSIEEAVAKAELMDTQELLINIGPNPTIDIEEGM
jgi:phage FluMu protein Com